MKPATNHGQTLALSVLLAMFDRTSDITIDVCHVSLSNIYILEYFFAGEKYIWSSTFYYSVVYAVMKLATG
jgi:hypothetical protein